LPARAKCHPVVSSVVAQPISHRINGKAVHNRKRRARQRIPESSIEMLGHSVGGITYRHYAHRARLAFNANMTLPRSSKASCHADPTAPFGEIHAVKREPSTAVLGLKRQ